MNAYDVWMKWKPAVGVPAALFLWVASFIFFMVGMGSQPMYVNGKDVSVFLAAGFSIANTLIQLAGAFDKEKDWVTYTFWLASYGLGIALSTWGLMLLWQLPNKYAELFICLCLGIMVEIAPEKLIAQFLKSLKSGRKPYSPNYTPQAQGQKPISQPGQQPGYRPSAQPSSFAQPTQGTGPTYRPADLNARK
jgi:hypothetical protein